MACCVHRIIKIPKYPVWFQQRPRVVNTFGSHYVKTETQCSAYSSMFLFTGPVKSHCFQIGISRTQIRKYCLCFSQQSFCGSHFLTILQEKKRLMVMNKRKNPSLVTGTPSVCVFQTYIHLHIKTTQTEHPPPLSSMQLITVITVLCIPRISKDIEETKDTRASFQA